MYSHMIALEWVTIFWGIEIKVLSLTLYILIINLICDIYITFQNTINERIHASDKELALEAIHW